MSYLTPYEISFLKDRYFNKAKAVTAVTTWTTRTSAADEAWTSICWSPELGIFCAISNASSYSVMTSPDGINWTVRSTPSLNIWRSVCWSPELGIFCAVSNNGTNRVMTSPDGITWTNRTVSTAVTWEEICWSPELGLFCAIGSNQSMVSSDGTTWSVNQITATATGLYSICWSPELNIFCVVGDLSYISSNGINWTSITPSITYIKSVCWSPELGIFCAISYSTTTANKKATISSDGINWISSTTTFSAGNWRRICWSPELMLFCISSFASTGIMTSPDGLIWTGRDAVTYNTWEGICWSPELGIFCAVSNTGASNRVITSTPAHLGKTVFNKFINYIHNGLTIKEGTNCAMGVATLASGVVTVSNKLVTATSRIFLVHHTVGGTPGFLRVTSRTAGTSFVITSYVTTDTSVIAYLIFEPA